MYEAAKEDDINLEKMRKQQEAIKKAEEEAKAKFWAEYERLHGEKQAKEEVIE